MDPEVLVIGGGPAGLAAAIAAAQARFSVEVAEPLLAGEQRGFPGRELPEDELPGIDKCCGEGLLPPAVSALAQLGIPAHMLAEYGHPLAGISFRYEGRQAHADFGPASSASYGVRRSTLHRLLLARAREAGVRFTARTARLARNGGSQCVLVGGRLCRPRWIVGADGAQSATRTLAGLDHGRVPSSRFALRRHFQLSPDRALPRVEVYWAPGMQAYLTPVGKGRVGVAILARSRLCGMAKALERFPELLQLLDGAVPCSSPRGAVTRHCTLDRVHAGTLALVGDASGSVDAVTGDGLSLAFWQALVLAAALRKGDLRVYARAHARLMRPARIMSRALLAMGAHPFATGAAMLALERVPGLFPGLLHLHAQPPLPPIRSQEEIPWQPVPTSTRSTT